MCSRFACVEFCDCAVCGGGGGGGTAIEFCCDHGVKISPDPICAWAPPLFCHVRDESGADAMRVTFYFERYLSS